MSWKCQEDKKGWCMKMTTSGILEGDHDLNLIGLFLTSSTGPLCSSSSSFLISLVDFAWFADSCRMLPLAFNDQSCHSKSYHGILSVARQGKIIRQLNDRRHLSNKGINSLLNSRLFIFWILRTRSPPSSPGFSRNGKIAAVQFHIGKTSPISLHSLMDKDDAPNFYLPTGGGDDEDPETR